MTKYSTDDNYDTTTTFNNCFICRHTLDEKNFTLWDNECWPINTCTNIKNKRSRTTRQHYGVQLGAQHHGRQQHEGHC